MKDIVENNKLIAEFMGVKHLYSTVRLETLKYHSDWNWLMEVLDKIYKMDLYYDKYIDYNSSMFTSGKIELSTNIHSVHGACVEFIKWYNLNKTI